MESEFESTSFVYYHNGIISTTVFESRDNWCNYVGVFGYCYAITRNRSINLANQSVTQMKNQTKERLGTMILQGSY